MNHAKDTETLNDTLFTAEVERPVGKNRSCQVFRIRSINNRKT